MRPASEIIDALHRAGATLFVEDGKARVRGAVVPAELLAEVKANREAVLAEWHRRQEAERDRYSVVPVADAARYGRELTFSKHQQDVLIAYVFRQARPVHAFVMRRSLEYHEYGIPLELCDAMACLDVLAWQRNVDGRKALSWLMEFEAATNPLSHEN
jgi:hypothetical protein